MMEAFAISPGFLTDRALVPLKRLAGPENLPNLRAYFFYLRKERMWASDGVNHTPVNPALMGYFDQIFQASVLENGRGSLSLILSEEANCRYVIMTDNQKLEASIIK